jgi:hypothetical protein
MAKRGKDQDKDLVLPNYPYRGRFSPEQVSAALDRKDRLVEAMTDAIGPDGTWINIPLDMLHILGFHLAFAGAEVFDDLALIESRVRENPGNENEHGLLWENLREWRPKGDFKDPDKPADADTQMEAQQMAAQLRRQSSPELRAALAEIFAEEAAEAAGRDQISGRERAQNVLSEQNIRKLNDQNGDGS